MKARKERNLSVVGETHVDPQRRRLALAVRKFLAFDSGVNVKVFLEGIRKGDEREIVDRLGVPCVGIEDKDIHSNTTIIATILAIARYNALIWSLANRDDTSARDFLEREKRRELEYRRLTNATASQIVSGEDLLASSFRELTHAKTLGTCFVQDPGSFLLSVMGDAKSGIAPGVRTEIESLLATLTIEDLTRTLVSLSTQIPEFFKREFGFTIKLEGLPTRIDPDPIESSLEGASTELLSPISSVFDILEAWRELYMGFSIAETDFSFGALNVGHAHSHSTLLIGLLTKAGIEVQRYSYSP